MSAGGLGKQRHHPHFSSGLQSPERSAMLSQVSTGVNRVCSIWSCSQSNLGEITWLDHSQLEALGEARDALFRFEVLKSVAFEHNWSKLDEQRGFWGERPVRHQSNWPIGVEMYQKRSESIQFKIDVDLFFQCNVWYTKWSALGIHTSPFTGMALHSCCFMLHQQEKMFSFYQ